MAGVVYDVVQVLWPTIIEILSVRRFAPIFRNGLSGWEMNSASLRHITRKFSRQIVYFPSGETTPEYAAHRLLRNVEQKGFQS